MKRAACRRPSTNWKVRDGWLRLVEKCSLHFSTWSMSTILHLSTVDVKISKFYCLHFYYTTGHAKYRQCRPLHFSRLTSTKLHFSTGRRWPDCSFLPGQRCRRPFLLRFSSRPIQTTIQDVSAWTPFNKCNPQADNKNKHCLGKKSNLTTFKNLNLTLV